MIHVFSNLEDTDDGVPPMCDMIFEIERSEFNQSTSSWQFSFCADATPHEPVGFDVDIPMTGWREQLDEDEDYSLHTYWSPITLRTRGSYSDRMVALMAKHYGLPPKKKKRLAWLHKFLKRDDNRLPTALAFPKSITCLAVAIASNPTDIAKEPVRMKLFFDDGMENSDYAEVFLNIDMVQGLAALNEKSEEYRDGLMRWFSRKGAVHAAPH